jgi:hypothetical protein
VTVTATLAERRPGVPVRYRWAREQLAAGADAWGDPAAAQDGGANVRWVVRQRPGDLASGEVWVSRRRSTSAISAA